MPTNPSALAMETFEWVTVDLNNDTKLNEVCDLLKQTHYVEDDEGLLRFKYLKAMLKW